MFTKLGVQLYTIYNKMQNEDDIKESFEKLVKLGYTEAQTAGCAIPYADFGRLAKEAGIKIVGTHDSWEMMLNDIDKVMENHNALGTTNVGIGGISGEYCESADGMKRFCELANGVAEKLGKNGFKFTYHNHSKEFVRFGDKTLMDILYEELDPHNASFVLDTYWVQHGGGDVRAWIEKLAGRIDILHLKDMAIKNMQDGPYITEIGHGNMSWAGIIDTAEKAGVKHFVVEQDICPGDPFDSLEYSAKYLKQFMK